jgi:hypothetical protein
MEIVLYALAAMLDIPLMLPIFTNASQTLAWVMILQLLMKLLKDA